MGAETLGHLSWHAAGCFLGGGWSRAKAQGGIEYRAC